MVDRSRLVYREQVGVTWFSRSYICGAGPGDPTYRCFQAACPHATSLVTLCIDLDWRALKRKQPLRIRLRADSTNDETGARTAWCPVHVLGGHLRQWIFGSNEA